MNTALYNNGEEVSDIEPRENKATTALIKQITNYMVDTLLFIGENNKILVPKVINKAAIKRETSSVIRECIKQHHTSTIATQLLSLLWYPGNFFILGRESPVQNAINQSLIKSGYPIREEVDETGMD